MNDILPEQIYLAANVVSLKIWEICEREDDYEQSREWECWKMGMLENRKVGKMGRWGMGRWKNGNVGK